VIDAPEVRLTARLFGWLAKQIGKPVKAKNLVIRFRLHLAVILTVAAGYRKPGLIDQQYGVFGSVLEDKTAAITFDIASVLIAIGQAGSAVHVEFLRVPEPDADGEEELTGGWIELYCTRLIIDTKGRWEVIEPDFRHSLCTVLFQMLCGIHPGIARIAAAKMAVQWTSRCGSRYQRPPREN